MDKILEFVSFKCEKGKIDPDVKAKIKDEYEQLSRKAKQANDYLTFFEEYLITILKDVNLYCNSFTALFDLGFSEYWEHG